MHSLTILADKELYFQKSYKKYNIFTTKPAKNKPKPAQIIFHNMSPLHEFFKMTLGVAHYGKMILCHWQHLKSHTKTLKQEKMVSGEFTVVVPVITLFRTFIRHFFLLFQTNLCYNLFFSILCYLSFNVAICIARNRTLYLKIISSALTCYLPSKTSRVRKIVCSTHRTCYF